MNCEIDFHPRWYKVNYSNAEELLYGRNAGCVFATRSCLSFFNQQRTM